jgi:hypothetical protein
MPGVAVEFPANWDETNGVAFCLNCRRMRAGEAKAAALGEGESPAAHLRADAEGRVEFELARAPDRCDTRVARACGTNVTVVRGVRERLGAYPTQPV